MSLVYTCSNCHSFSIYLCNELLNHKQPMLYPLVNDHNPLCHCTTSQPCQRPVCINNSQKLRANLRDRFTACKLHASLEVVIQNLKHQLDSLLTIMLSKDSVCNHQYRYRNKKYLPPIPKAQDGQPSNTLRLEPVP